MVNKYEILKERAEKLKEKIDIASQESNALKVLSFFLADERYALEAEFVKRVIALKYYTPLPCTPEYLMGIINLESTILAIIDLKKLFNLPDKGITNLNRVVIVNYEGIEFGIITDEIIGRENIDIKEIQTALPDIAGIDSSLIRGVTADKLIVLDTKKLILDERLTINDKI